MRHTFNTTILFWTQTRLPLQARPPAKPARHSPEAQPMADGQGEAARGTSGQVNTDEIEKENAPVKWSAN